MVDTIVVNGLYMCHKNSEGLTRSTLPDVCKSPVQPAPYTNVAFGRDLYNGTVTVRSHGGAPNGVKGSEFHTSIGDEPGVGGGVKSGTVKAEATWLSWSPNVFMEGQPVTRHTDKMLMNHGNTISAGGYQVRSAANNKEQEICNIACYCWVSLGGTSVRGLILDVIVPQAQRRYSACFKGSTDKDFPKTEIGKPGHPGLVSEAGYWDPNNPLNTTEGGKSPGMPIGKEAPWFGGQWYDFKGSRWLDAVWVDDSGQPTDMWDIKFGNDRQNERPKDKAYEDIAKQNGSVYRGEFQVPEYCNMCEDEEKKAGK
ncbi:DUF4150 domain-containing protein [Methylobacterium fujisawaense]|uniref:DUF4150 domain-containing protein n=1 Tax=Methylobacterium fujisawaense TaxID=107400 RepID=UPI00313AF380